jgi:hypothetical protein
LKVLERDAQQDAGRSAVHYRRFLSIVAIVFVVGLLSNVALSAWNFGRFTETTRGLCSYIDSKVTAASRIDGPKVLFIGGSNLNQGLSAQRISEAVDVPSFNFGLQAGLGPRLILFEAKRVLRPGDTAFLVLEYNHYTDDRWNEVSSDILFGCAADYFRQMSVLEKFEALLSLTPFRVFDVLAFRENAARQDRRTSPGNDGSNIAAKLRYGDRIAPDSEVIDETTQRRLQLYQPMTISMRSDAEGPRALASFVEWARAHGVKVVATWPNTIYFSAYGSASGFVDITNFYKELGVPVIGRPQDAMYPTDLFHDTQYHLNVKGIAQRTTDMIAMINANRWLLPAHPVKAEHSIDAIHVDAPDIHGQSETWSTR